MMARQGVIHWPQEGAVQSALVDEFDLPLLESTVDLALVVHGLELTDSPIEMLQEVWRVMAPQGRLVLVVPNRRGLVGGFRHLALWLWPAVFAHPTFGPAQGGTVFSGFLVPCPANAADKKGFCPFRRQRH